MVVAGDDSASGRGAAVSDAVRMIADLQRLRGPLRIAVRETEDGLGIYIPPARRFGIVPFLLVWLCGWAAGEWFVLAELVFGGINASDLFLLVWLVPWTVAGLGTIWIICWQFFGEERLYFTADALVRDWKMLWFGARRIVSGRDIRSVVVDGKISNDVAGFGTVKVETSGKTMRIGSGLPEYEGQLVATLIRGAADGKPDDGPADAEMTQTPVR